ncbi:MAG: hypothetical protein ACRDYF_02705, partial [Acidimicrobiia bacterium]
MKVVLPDTDGEVAHHLGQLEEVVLQLQPYDEEDEPAPAGLGPDALEALQRILSAVLAAERTPAVPLLGAGSFELVPLRILDLDPADLAAVGRAIAALGHALLVKDELVTDVVENFSAGPHQTPNDLVAGFARAHGVLDLGPDDDTRTLAALLAVSGAGPVVLTGEQEAAYERFTGRALA